MQKYIIFGGMARSGNHAIINWFRPTIPHLFVIDNYRIDKYKTSKMPNFPVVLAQGLKKVKRDLNKIEIAYSVSVEDFRVFEDDTLERVIRAHSPSCSIQKIFIIRDPSNCLASRFEHRSTPPFTRKPKTFSMMQQLWKKNACLALQSDDWLVVKYDRWRADIEYRRELCAYFGKPLNDQYFTTLAKAGGGSSFSKRRIKDATLLETESRWKHYIDDENYLSMFDEELLDMAEEIFGKTPGLQEIRKKKGFS